MNHTIVMILMMMQASVAPGEILVQEDFEDTNLKSRGLYDIAKIRSCINGE